MKLLVGLVFVVFGVMKIAESVDSEEGKKMIREMSGDCKTKEGATDDHVENMINNGMPTERPDKCLRACMMEQFGIMDNCLLVKENLIEITKMATENNEEKISVVTEIAEECKETAAGEGDRCECALKIVDCMKAGAEKRGIDPKELR